MAKNNKVNVPTKKEIYDILQEEVANLRKEIQDLKDIAALLREDIKKCNHEIEAKTRLRKIIHT